MLNQAHQTRDHTIAYAAGAVLTAILPVDAEQATHMLQALCLCVATVATLGSLAWKVFTDEREYRRRCRLEEAKARAGEDDE